MGRHSTKWSGVTTVASEELRQLNYATPPMAKMLHKKSFYVPLGTFTRSRAARG
ncbi:MAG: hypothetical protein ACI8PT_002576 [Gammaproteobacteria bacterium]|jgi:hypothetical protein